MIKLVSDSDPILKTEPSLWDFENPLGIIRRLDIENDTWYKSGEVVSDQLDIQDKLKAPDLYDMLIQHMVYHEGIGLSANQIGIPFKVFSMMVNDKDVICCFNPKIIEESDEQVIFSEGCLSFPQLFLKIKRPERVMVKYQNADGDEISAHFDGLAARVFQHEMDHMNGTTYLNRVGKVFLQSARRKQRTLLRKERRHGRTN
jgi:peptide deformylase